MNTEEFEERLKALRPRLHRYCARMTGSAVHGEDVLQDALIKALHARAQGGDVDNLEGWLFRIAHNASLDFLRGKARNTVVPLTEDLEAAAIPESDMIVIGFQTFLQLPELQRCAVILKDVLGHSIEEIAGIADCSAATAKSALQRGRAALRRLAKAPEDARLPLMSCGLGFGFRRMIRTCLFRRPLCYLPGHIFRFFVSCTGPEEIVPVKYAG